MIHIVPECQRLVGLRFGNFEKTAGPGIVLLLPPPIQSVAKTVDLREFVVEIPPEACITRAGVPISLGLLVYQKVVDPKGAFLNTQNVRKNIQASAANTLRAVVADISLDDAHPERDRLTIANEVRVELDEITRRSGVQITNVSIDFLICQKVVEPKDSFLNIQNFRQAIQGIATTTLRAVVGNIPLDDVLAKREQINEELRVKLDDITHRWGVKVTNVEIKELTPPRDVQEAMNRQLTAERTRRASVTEAEGKKASAILVADGAKQAAILEAEGARQAAILRAEGFALAI